MRSAQSVSSIVFSVETPGRSWGRGVKLRGSRGLGFRV